MATLNSPKDDVVSVSPMLPPIPPDWRSLLKEETRKAYYCALEVFLEK